MKYLEINNLDKWQYVLPLIQKIVPNDIAIGLSDREKYLLYLPGKNFDLEINVGEYIKPDSSISKAMINGREIHIRISKTVFGQEYLVSAIPIYDDYNNVIGAVAISTSVDIQDLVMQMSSELSNAINKIASNAEEISSQTQEVAASCEELRGCLKDSGVRVLETNSILGVLKNISRQTNMIGINAAIEAGRLGGQGLGFSVVASEIRKLSDNTSQSIKKIEKIVTGIQIDSNNNQDELCRIGEMTLEIAKTVTDIAVTLQETKILASKLDKIADGLRIW